MLTYLETVSTFESALKSIQAKLDEMFKKQQCILTKLYEVEAKIKNNTQLFNQSENMFKKPSQSAKQSKA